MRSKSFKEPDSCSLLHANCMLVMGIVKFSPGRTRLCGLSRDKLEEKALGQALQVFKDVQQHRSADAVMCPSTDMKSI